MDLGEKLSCAAEAVKSADALLITAGAGMGVDSGLPDFRGKEGFWRAYPAMAKHGLSFEEMANPMWFRDKPALAWAFYGHRFNLYRQTQPHAGFAQLLELGMTKARGCFVFTSNVDGHFQRAGFAAERVHECHGSILHFQCATPCSEEIWEAESEAVEVDDETFRAAEPLPKCRRCGGLARPNVLMFGDWLWQRHRSGAQLRLFDAWLAEVQKSSSRLAIIELGAGLAVPTVRLTSESLARRFGGTLIRINVREAEVPRGHIGIPLGAAEGIRGIYERVREWNA